MNELSIKISPVNGYLKQKNCGEFTILKRCGMKNFQIKNRSGQMMVEAMVAITIVVVGLLGIFSLTSRSLSLNQVITSQYVASNLSAEGIEVVKNILDRNIIQRRPWNEGISPGEFEVDYASTATSIFNNRKLNFDPATGFYSYAAGTPTTYLRKITVDQISPDELHVRSIVDWTTRDGGAFQIITEDRFFNWR